ncbi:acyl carrier protein [Rhodoferax sp. 4810]|uniref:Acyl carrier protein n=1 Tax=Thiospirillum jenense TaxID=1653858 RepID=A0A839HEL4_9GAMM|nr:phosphopantetheine-binding protein [Thiospirillum jenense]MBB1075839.1 acyl carrier protein [Rhodoferax jenense]MBB1126914.1 acyl carrier protein [Thiospirillum jenense]
MNSTELARDLLRSALQLGSRADRLTPDSAIAGALPEFNSLTVVGLIAGLEEQLGCEVSDEEITEDIFRTLGSFAQFIETKMA